MGDDRERGSAMANDVVGLAEMGRGRVDLVGGKGAQLGELTRLEGLGVPEGFVVTTAAFRRIAAMVVIDDQLDVLAGTAANDRAAVRSVSARIREAFQGVAIPEDLVAAIGARVDRLGGRDGWAVRSSATAEDLPSASFAGQHDTFLNAVGPVAVLRDVRRCWASLFTERAVSYRMHHGIDHRGVEMAVVVQRMVAAEASGVLFTADPVTGNRRVARVEAAYGLGEAFVAGRVRADVVTVRDGEVVARSVATKRVAVGLAPHGGTQERPIAAQLQDVPVLTDAQVVRLVQLGRRIEAHAGCPQDIEWCVLDEHIHIVQSRPITTLFPVPVVGDDEHHVYVPSATSR